MLKRRAGVGRVGKRPPTAGPDGKLPSGRIETGAVTATAAWLRGANSKTGARPSSDNASTPGRPRGFYWHLQPIVVYAILNPNG